MNNTKNQFVTSKILEEKGISLCIKREDKIHPFISGNKFRKLKFNLLEAKKQGYKTLLSFGGAYSNHISALSYAGKVHGFKTIGVIRGDELASDIENTLESNPTLRFAHNNGMQLKFVSREDYRLKDQPDFVAKRKKEFGKFYDLLLYAFENDSYNKDSFSVL